MGIISLVQLPVEQFPEIAPPTVSVQANYTGANAETVLKSVVVPLEEALNGVENMMYMTSSATNAGMANIRIYFRQGTDPDMATVNVQNRIASAQGLLPTEVKRSGITVRKRQTSNIKALALYSPDNSFDEKFLNNYLKINIEPRLARIAGVGEVNVMGSDYSLRIWLDPGKMTRYNLVPSDITAVLDEQNLEAPTGTLGTESENTFQYVLKYRGRYEFEQDYENMVIKSLPGGEELKLKDVATIELGSRTYTYIGEVNGHPGSNCMIAQTSGSNANEIIEEIDRVVEDIRKNLPNGMEIADLMSTKDFLDASIKNVIKTLIEAIILVILVVYVFLQSFRSTFIPAVSIIVSLIGTFAFLAVAGFSLNMLTLFALVLVIGTVVDDAIIVVEAVQARFDSGYKSSYLATVDAMGGITSAIITSTLVFMAVFIPVSMMGGTSGTFYTQFGITMAVAVGISALNALTLSPALCALLLKPYVDEDGNVKNNFAARFRKAYNTAFSAVLKKYQRGVMVFIKHKWLTWATLGLAMIGLVLLMNNTKTGLVPDEDQGTIMINVTTAPGSSLAETNKIMGKVGERLKSIPQIRDFQQVAGYGMIAGQGNSYGMCIVRLKDWSERPDKADAVNAVIGQIYARTADIKDAQIFAVAPPMITGYGTSAGFEMYLQDRAGGDITDFYNIYLQYIYALNQRPEIQMAYSTFNINFPQYMVDIDAAKAKRAGISPTDILSTLSGYYGGQYVSNINRFSKVYRVMIQADPKYRLDPESLNNVYVRMQNGEMAPISQFVKLTKVYGSEVLSRFNMYNSIAVSGTVADGYSTGDAIKAIEEVAEQVLPKGYGYDFGGLTREESQTGSNTAIIFGICIILIYLILSALYESFLIPFAVILAVPCGLLGSFILVKLIGQENNIYLQTGLIMIIGLLSKTAILITEYAADRRKSGMSLSQAAFSAAKARLRPILMTVLTCVFGMIPLVIATGVGANGNSTLGSGVVGGMIVGTLALLFLVPSLFIVFQHLQEKVKPIQFTNTPDWMIEAEIEDSKKENEEKK